ncbi:YqaJ viral recombinase family protein [Comamonas kerstersii]|uniref:YqaJ viral recombinase family nuclease n=1 Tax=Comamonas kerstersii TaxID=225992 RepID=UPI000984FEDE|nr:YqaJ viral recombinase family protein [Comamonas kerstersii]OOH85401.1 endonuclease [Comamonas kerstersii]OOH90593.1 endonuclease [Comamonas kerstersii]
MSLHLVSPSGHGAAAPVSPARSPRKGAALRLVSTKDMARDDWLEVRRTGIGSSDAAAAVGLNPYQSQLELWMLKTGKGDLLPAIDPLDDTSPMFWGTLLEPIVAAHYTKRTGNKVRRVNAVLQHPEHTWMLANVDREVVGAGDVQILECKTAGIHGARLWRDGVPQYVQLQVMHQLAVTGHRAADVAVLIGGQELQIFRIERDEALIARLIEMEHAFWQMVESKTPPAGDGSDSAEKALRSLYPHSAGDDVDMSDDPELNATFEALLVAREQLEAAQKNEARLRQAIQIHMGEAGKATFACGGSVTWRRSKDGQVFNTAQFNKDHPELAKAYMSTRAGARRFCVNET